MSDWFAVGSGVRQGCRIALDLFLGPMDDGTHGTPRTLRKEGFTYLDFADDASFLAEMLEVLVLGLTIMQEEAFTFGLQINSSKTKILQVHSSTSNSVLVADRHVEVDDAFVYLGCLIDSSGGSRGEVLRWISPA